MCKKGYRHLDEQQSLHLVAKQVSVVEETEQREQERHSTLHQTPHGLTGNATPAMCSVKRLTDKRRLVLGPAWQSSLQLFFFYIFRNITSNSMSILCSKYKPIDEVKIELD